jgi:hypothetical protein
MEHDFLEVAWLCRGVVTPKGLEVVILQRLPEASGDSTTSGVIEALSTIGVQGCRLVRAKANIQRRPHLAHHDGSPRFALSWEISVEDFYV